MAAQITPAAQIKPYVGQTLPSKVVWVTNDNLYRIAALYLGDPTQWYRIVELNGLPYNPFINGPIELAIPQKGKSNGGIPSFI